MYQIVIGLEVHVQLATQSKCFCGCSTLFGSRPNTQTCPVCLGLPGSLPVLNESVLKLALKVALALNCAVAELIRFDRKNYFYPDLPKNFQISQYDLPLSGAGWLEIDSGSRAKRIGIRRTHLEEDAGKLIHRDSGVSLIDFNRCGMPLLEIVSEPDLNSPQEAYDYLLRLKAILEYLEVSDCNMEEGSLRCDANISLMKKEKDLPGEKVELKNMNTFKGVRQALEYEVRRQSDLLNKKKKVTQETRLWDAEKNITVSMRSKEEAHDYRYFPEPDLVPFMLDQEYIRTVGKSLPELPHKRAERLVRDYQIPSYDAGVLTADKYLADYFEECLKFYPRPKVVSNWMMTELLAQLNSRNMPIGDLEIKPRSFTAIFELIDEGIVSAKMAKEILAQMLDTKKEAREIVAEKGLKQISDSKELARIAQEVIAQNPKPVADYSRGNLKALMFLVGQLMRKSRGKANPEIANKILKEKLQDQKGAA